MRAPSQRDELHRLKMDTVKKQNEFNKAYVLYGNKLAKKGGTQKIKTDNERMVLIEEALMKIVKVTEHLVDSYRYVVSTLISVSALFLLTAS